MNINVIDANNAVAHITSNTLSDNREIHHFAAYFDRKTVPDRII